MKFQLVLFAVVAAAYAEAEADPYYYAGLPLAYGAYGGYGLPYYGGLGYAAGGHVAAGVGLGGTIQHHAGLYAAAGR